MKTPVLDSLILKHISRLLLFLVNLYAWHLLFQGHNAPGGGFIAGLISATSLVLIYLAFGKPNIERWFSIDPLNMALFGLLLAYITSFVPVLQNKGFLTHSSYHLDIPFFGELHASTTLLFDTGVYLVVVGVTCKLIFTYAHKVYNQETP